MRLNQSTQPCFGGLGPLRYPLLNHHPEAQAFERRAGPDMAVLRGRVLYGNSSLENKRQELYFRRGWCSLELKVDRFKCTQEFGVACHKDGRQLAQPRRKNPGCEKTQHAMHYFALACSR